MSIPSYIIVGSGVFGASTALHLIRKYPNASITLVDRNAYDAATRVAASWDWNKVVRSDYSQIVYTRLGLEAQDLWRNDPIWKPFYHQTGVVYISPTSFAEEAHRNFDKLGAKVDLHKCSVEEARTLYDGLFSDADYSGVKEVLANKSSGWAEAKEALQSTIQAAVDLGVKYVTAEVITIELDTAGSQRRCRGVKMADGSSISANQVVLCTGAFTPRLLLDSAPDWEDLHAGSRIIAAGVTEAVAPLGVEFNSILDKLPVGINVNPMERGYEVGSLPLPKMNALKYWGQIIFQNTLQDPVTHQLLSMPPRESDYAQWKVPSTLMDDVGWSPKSMLGNKPFGYEIEKFRICWDALTPSEDFIISPHSACEGLFVATCGSFHGFKFLPVLGKYVVQMLCSELDPALQKRWAWDRELPPLEERKKWPQKELRDLWD